MTPSPRFNAPLAPGDRIRYTTAWLRDTCTLTGPLPFARGTITSLSKISHDMTLAYITWVGGGDLPERVNVRNLERI